MGTRLKESALDQNVVNELRKLVLFNSRHMWDDVILQLQKATGYDVIHCEQIAMIAHTKGKSTVKSGEVEDLERIDAVLHEINLVTSIE